MRDPGQTPSFRGPDGEVVSGSIAEVSYLRLGGIDPWVMIRGESVAVRERLGKTTVAIFGHSWGSALGVLHAARFPRKVAAYVGSGQYGDAAAGEPASYAMWAETSRLNLLDLVPALEMPVFFLLGRNDHWVPPEASVAYFEALTAPSKGVVWFEQSGHEPFVDEPAKFNRAMAELARPVLPSDL